jgi:1,4-dihydroxy-6-naphthoate synthase
MPAPSSAAPSGSSDVPEIRLAYSVDADDAFMFHALAAGKIDTRGLRFSHRRADTATLNRLTHGEEADVVAVSLGAVPAVADRYLLLPHGASVGRGYGPVVVARQPVTLEALRGRKVGIPGTSTTAWLVLRLMEPSLVPEVIPIAPFTRVFEALDAGQIDAALLIHEGRLLYEERGYARVAELGEWWLRETGLPLPLGVNVIRRGLGEPLVANVSAVLRDAIAWALANRDEVMKVIAAEERGDEALGRTALLDRYLGMYANEDTAGMAPDVRKGIDVLFTRARAAGLLGEGVPIDWAP